MIIVYRDKPSESANELVDGLLDAGLPAKRIRKEENLRVRENDYLICWGSAVNRPPATGGGQGPNVLNNTPLVSKFMDAQLLSQAGVATITVSAQRQIPRPAGRGDFTLPAPDTLSETQARVLMGEIQAYLATPLPPTEEWLGRRNNHVGGSDLLRPTPTPDFYVRKEPITTEFRLHMWKGKSIRAGMKMNDVEGVAPHPWIRSLEAGWRIHYQDFKSTKAMKALASSALTALGLDFGAVDLAQRPDGSLFVLEVNRAPGIEGGTVDAYVKAIEGWVRGNE